MAKLLYIFILACAASNLINLRNELNRIIQLIALCEDDVAANLPFYAIEIIQIKTRIIDTDPIYLLEEMTKITSLEQMLFFWYSYDSRMILNFFSETEPLIISKISKNVINCVLASFKRFVLEKVVMFRDDPIEGNRDRFFDTAIKLYHIWFKKFTGHELVLGLLQVQCQLLNNNDPKSLIIAEFHGLKRYLITPQAMRNFTDFRCHLENFYMLVLYFTSKPDDLHGLLWVMDQTPLFNLLYLFFHGNPSILDNCENENNFDSLFHDLKNVRMLALWSLNDLIPIFDYSMEENEMVLKFYDPAGYFNSIINTNEMLRDLVTRITIKTMQVTEDTFKKLHINE